MIRWRRWRMKRAEVISMERSYTDDQNPVLNESWNHGGVIAEPSENHIYSLYFGNFCGMVYLPLLLVDQLENRVLGRRVENNDKSAR